MKTYAFLSLASIVLLSLLTARSGYEALTQAGDAKTFEGKAEADTIGSDAAHAKQLLAADLEFLRHARRTAYAPFSPADPAPRTGISKAIEPVAVKWAGHSQVSAWVRDFSRASTALENLASKEDILARREAIEGLQAQVSQLQPVARLKLGSLAATQVRDLTERVVSLEQQQHNRTVWTIAAASFNAQRYQECIDSLANWQGTASAEVKKLSARAAFMIDYTRLDEQANRLVNQAPSEEWDRLIRELESVLLRKYPSPPSADDEYNHARLTNILQYFHSQRRLAALGVPRGPLRDWLVEAQSIVAQSRSAAAKSRGKAYELFSTWCAARVGAKETQFKNLQYAKKERFPILIGEITLQPGGYHKYAPLDNPAEYKYIEDYAVFDQLPTETCVEEFNSELRLLSANLRDKNRWQQFLSKCEAWQKELDEFSRLGGKEYVDVSFTDEAATAREVVANLPLLLEVLGN